jgi:hypothetical protein
MKKNQSYVAPCVAPKSQKSTAITMTLIAGGILVALGGIGNGTTDLHIAVLIAGLLIAGWGASRIIRL